jgi:ABC-2 type transport system permease protein
MRNFWLVARHEFIVRISKRSFLVGAFMFPTMIIGVMAFSIFIAIGMTASTPVGYVDLSGLFTESLVPDPKQDELVEMRSFHNEARAHQALEQGEIQGYYIIPGDYLSNPRLSYYFMEDQPGGQVAYSFAWLARTNLSTGLPENVRDRLIEEPLIILRSMDGRQEFSQGDIFRLLLPFFTGFVFVMAVMSTASYMLQVITDEKESRTMEVLMTTLTPSQFIGGKTAGLITLAFSMILTWLITVIVGVSIASNFIELLHDLTIPWDFLLIIFLFFIPSFLLISGVMTAIGGAVTELRHGQQIAGLLNMSFMLPYFLSALAFSNPNSPIMVALTLFPTTALVTITLRWGVSGIPSWQIIISWLILTGSALLSVIASARIFRIGMLMYGQGLNFWAVWKAIRAS